MWTLECISPSPSALFESVVESERCGRAIEHRGWWMGRWMHGQGRRWECKFGGEKKEAAHFWQSWISGLAAAHCSACLHTKHYALALDQLQSGQWARSLQLALFGSSSLTFWLTILSSPSSSSSSFHPLLPLASSYSRVFLPSLFLSLAFFLQPSGGTAGCGFRPGPPGFHSDTLCPDVISIDDVQLGQAVLAQGVFTVYCKLRPFTKRCVCICDITAQPVCLFHIKTGVTMDERGK